MRPEIIILTGPVHTGKSTALQQWAKHRQATGKLVRGLLNPDIEGRKKFIDAASGETFSMEAQPGEASLEVGKYRFSAAAFERARLVISRESLLPADFFVLDEIGKLELADQGLEPAVSDFLSNVDDLCPTVILVIRDFLVDDAIRKYGLQKSTVIDKSGLP